MSRQYKDALKGIRFSRGMCISEGTRSLPLIVEYVSPLLHVITPTNSSSRDTSVDDHRETTDSTYCGDYGVGKDE